MKKIVNSLDPAVRTLSDIKIGKWNLDNVREWIRAVLGEDQTSALICIINYLTKSATSSTNEKNIYQGDINQNDPIVIATTSTSTTLNTERTSTPSPLPLLPPQVSHATTSNTDSMKRKYPKLFGSFNQQLLNVQCFLKWQQFPAM